MRLDVMVSWFYCHYYGSGNKKWGCDRRQGTNPPCWALAMVFLRQNMWAGCAVTWEGLLLAHYTEKALCGLTPLNNNNNDDMDQIITITLRQNNN